MATHATEERTESRNGNPAMAAGVMPPARDGPEAPPCAHYWVIEPADGPLSRGMCQVCLEVRDFKNYVDSYDSGDN